MVDIKDRIGNLGVNLAYIQGETAALMTDYLELRGLIELTPEVEAVCKALFAHAENILKVQRKSMQALAAVQTGFDQEHAMFPPEEKARWALFNAGKDVPTAETTLTIGSWPCPDPDDRHPDDIPNPLGVCVYNQDEDPANDFCLFCGNPDERK